MIVGDHDWMTTTVGGLDDVSKKMADISRTKVGHHARLMVAANEYSKTSVWLTDYSSQFKVFICLTTEPSYRNENFA